uniref:G-protein coupled receptors family 1 profile domain-containing protein n=1 Tax=Biomphalaria glabrata TaxID=6526 RepID=A0A2C9KKM1_BIOGL
MTLTSQSEVLSDLDPTLNETTITVTQQVLSDYEAQMFLLVVRIACCSIIGLFGMVSNVINLYVFVKQGLNTSINISFFAMAISDLIRIVTVQWMNFCSLPNIDTLGIPWVFSDIRYLSASWPTGCANRITLFITAYITAERFLCIVFPLKIKKMIKPSRTVLILLAIDVVNTLGLVPEYASVYYEWKFYPAKNRTLLGMAFRSNRSSTQGVTFSIHAALLTIALVAVIVFTIVLVIQLKSKSQWRKDNTGNKSQMESMSNRDKKTVKLVILIAVVMAFCYTPAVVLSLVSSFIPDFGVGGRQSKLFHSTWSFAYLTGIINASVNIFIYYKLSSKYKSTFKELFGLTSQTKQ